MVEDLINLVYSMDESIFVRYLYFLVIYLIILVIFLLIYLIAYIKKQKITLLRGISCFLFFLYLLLFAFYTSCIRICEKADNNHSVNWTSLSQIYQRVIKDSDDIYLMYNGSYTDAYTIGIYGANESLMSYLREITEVTDHFITLEKYAMEDEKMHILFYGEEHFYSDLPYEEGAIVSLYNYRNEELIKEEKHWMIDFYMSQYLQNFESCLTQYSFSAGVDNVWIEEPSDYRRMEEWDGLQYFSGHIYGSEENAYEIEAFLKEKFPDAIINVEAYH